MDRLNLTSLLGTLRFEEDWKWIKLPFFISVEWTNIKLSKYCSRNQTVKEKMTRFEDSPANETGITWKTERDKENLQPPPICKHRSKYFLLPPRTPNNKGAFDGKWLFSGIIRENDIERVYETLPRRPARIQACQLAVNTSRQFGRILLGAFDALGSSAPIGYYLQIAFLDGAEVGEELSGGAVRGCMNQLLTTKKCKKVCWKPNISCSSPLLNWKTFPISLTSINKIQINRCVYLANFLI